jgi:ABC-type proline/glycine betaine transport system permease subunit
MLSTYLSDEATSASSSAVDISRPPTRDTASPSAIGPVVRNPEPAIGDRKISAAGCSQHSRGGGFTSMRSPGERIRTVACAPRYVCADLACSPHLLGFALARRAPPTRRDGLLTFTEYVRENRIEIINDAIRHVDLTLAVMAIAVVIGVGLGVLTYRRSILAGLATTTTGAFLTIPSLALFAVFVGPFGLGFTNVLIGLVMYALLPITRNTIVGLRGVDSAVVDAARGMGMGPFRLLWRVRIPLAWPVILSGIRVSTQITIGIAAIGAIVKGPGLGEQIVDGLNRFGAANSVNEIAVGTLGIIVLALLFDLVYVLVLKLTTRGLRG